MSLRRLSVVVLFVTFTLSASTITTTWNGQTDGSWTNAANWSGGVASNSATSNFNAIFPDVSPAGTNSVTLASDVTISGLSLGAMTSLAIHSGNTLTLDSGTFTSQGALTGAVAISGAATVTFGGTSGGFNGTLTNSSTGTVTFQSTRTPDLVNPAGGVINVNSVNLIGGTIANDGSITVTGGTLGTFGNAVVVSGAGTLTLVGVNTAGNNLNNSSTIEGYGTVNQQITNSGTITASGGGLTLASSLNNSGTLQANDGGTLTIQMGASNTSIIKANTGGIVTMNAGDTGSTGGTLLADGGTLNLLGSLRHYSGSVVAQNSGTVVATNVTLDGLDTVHSTGTLDLHGVTASSITVDSGGTLKAGGIITTLSNSGSVTSSLNLTTHSFTNMATGTVMLSGDTLTLQGSFTNDGSIQMTNGTITNQSLITLSGSGTLTMNGSSLFGNQLENGASHTIEGSGGINLSLINSGKLIASGGNLTVGSSFRFTNNGLLSADTGSVLITPTQADRFANLASGILTGGTYEAHGANAIEFAGAASLTTSDANISLFDGGQILDYGDLTTSISDNFRFNNGTFDLENTNYQATSAGDFENAGHLIVGAGSEFENGLQQPVTNEAGGIISGTGEITGSVENQGFLAPGDAPGQLTVGSYSQSAAGELDIEFGTFTSWSSLDVLGNAQLGGTLNVFTDAGFDAALGTEFRILTAATFSGAGFTNFETTDFNGKAFQLEQTAGGYDVEVVAAPEPATFPILMTLAGFAVVWSRRGAGRKKRRCDVGSNPA